jgi:hypothetical protein
MRAKKMKPFNGEFGGMEHRDRGSRSSWRSREFVANPNDLIDSIVDAIDYAEIARDAQGLIKARKLLNNDLRQAIDLFIQDEVRRALKGGRHSNSHSPSAAVEG